jgi:hypothetical protein
VHDRGDDPCESSTIPRRTKRVRRAASPRAQYAVPNSANVAKSLDVPADQTPLTSLCDVETIPVQGFLTRQILLSKVVYSFTVEEQFEHSCVRAWARISSDSRKQASSRPTKPHHPAVSRAGTTKRPNRFLSEDDQLLIELREDRGLPWKEIEYANQPVLNLVRQYDPKGERTLGIITKPDRLPAGSETESSFFDLVKG